MVKEIKIMRQQLYVLIDVIYSNPYINSEQKLKLVKLYQELDTKLENERQFYLAARKCKKLIERNGNKITVTLPEFKNKKVNRQTVAAYEFKNGVEKRYETIVKK